MKVQPGMFLVFLLLAGAIFTGGCTTTVSPPSDTGAAPGNLTSLMAKPLYSHASWGYEVVDLANGVVLAEKNSGQLFTPGSTVKLFTTAAALDRLGPDYRFVTPVYAIGPQDAEGYLTGELVLVASGDPTMGGRTLQNDTIEFTNADHVDANSLPDTQMTRTDPVAGLDLLADQVKFAGITRVRDVVIDDRLFEKEKLADPSPVTPIYINDNLIDILITPGTTGAPARVTTRPVSPLYRVDADVTTGEGDPALSITENNGTISVTGTIPAGHAPWLRTFVVTDSSSWARSLFIEALERKGIAVDAPPTGKNPGSALPAGYTGQAPVATLTSPPFSENVKLILKVSQNIHANALLGIMAAHEGKRTVEDGLLIEGDYLRRTGIDPGTLSLIDGEGSSNNRVSPHAAARLLTVMASGKNARVYHAALPILGVDGSLAHAAAPGNPAVGKVFAKTGTSAQGDMNGDIMLLAKGLAGYMTTRSGKDVAFVVYANNIRISSIEDLNAVNSDMGSFAGSLYEAF